MAGVWSYGGGASARSGLAGCGTQTAGLCMGGLDYTYFQSAKTQEYNGSSWSNGGNLLVALSGMGGCGTQTAGLCFGGSKGAGGESTTQEYNGSSWSYGGNLITARYSLAGCGTQTAGLSFGGGVATEEYNGTAWSAGGNLGTGRGSLAGCGTQTAGLSFGGDTNLTVTEEYNGTAWSAGGDLGTGRGRLAGCGTQTAGLSFGGYAASANVATTEEYDGTAWSVGGNLGTARAYLAGCGTQADGLSFCGRTTTFSGVTEEYTLNLSPVADAGGPYIGKVRSAVSFDGSGSTDPDGTIVLYEWTFGDSETDNGETVEHSYDAVDTYVVELTVTDDGGLTDTDTTTATISAVIKSGRPPRRSSGASVSGGIECGRGKKWR